MDSKQLRASLLAVTAAVAVAVSGTFAWQSISQTAMNETAHPTNPGGRLHDDFNGYGDGTTKDIYVENFGTEPIYARVRLDEYMEIGAGASKKSLDGTTPNPENKAVSVVTGAKIDDPTTWTTHIPGDTATGEGAETGFGNPARTFHTYWTWTMGGQTVYMPTFNKNKDSLKADINGTFAGLDPADDIYYDDYVAYKVNDAKTAAEFLDGDGDTPSGAETEHTAKETLTAQVITMAEYTALSDAEKASLNAWVYDTDGWAYWSQAIQPETATGLLLDQISLTTNPPSAWYYAINAVAQFITADDLGRADNTGFYDTTGGTPPTADALALLKFLGVDTGTIVVDIKNADNASVIGSPVTIQAGESANFNVDITFNTTGATPSNNWVWSISDDTSGGKITVDQNGLVSVASDATDGTSATITVTNSDDGSLTASFTVSAKKVTYAVTVTPATATVYPGKTQDFSATVTASDNSTVDQTVTWSVSGGVSGTAFSGSTLTVAAAETAGSLTVTATAGVDNSVTGTADVTVGAVNFTTDIKNADATASVKGSTVTIKAGESADFNVDVTSDPSGIIPTNNWAWSISDDTSGGKITVDQNGLVSVAADATGGATATVTVTNSDYTPALSASFTVTALTFAADIKNAEGVSVKNDTATLFIGAEGTTYTASAISSPAGYDLGGTWTWTSSNPDAATLSADTGETVTVSVPDTANIGDTSTITATNGTLNASFTVEARLDMTAVTAAINAITPGLTDTVTIDDTAWYVVAKTDSLTDTSSSTHKAALLLSKNILEQRAFNSSNSQWKGSNMETYLNNTASGGWLNGKTTIQSKAVEVKIYTRASYNGTTADAGTNDKVFLLSEADVYGESGYNGRAAVAAEYTNGAQLDCFTTQANRVATYNSSSVWWWLRSPTLGVDIMDSVSEDGTIRSNYYFTTGGGVRPAFWYNLDS